MKTTLYNAAMDRITMSGQCENSIIEAAVNITPSKEKKHFKMRFVPVIAAAAVLVTGTVTAAADGFDWVKKMFRDDRFEVTDEIAAMTSEMKNFSCISEDESINITPVGTIAENSTIYCLLHVESTSDDFDYRNLRLANVCANGFDSNDYDNRTSPKDIYGNEPEGWNFGFGMDYEDDNMLAVKVTANYKAFKENDRIDIKFAKVSLKYEDDYGFDTISSDSDEIENFADVSFNLSMGDINCLETEYDTSRVIDIDSYKMVAQKLTVSPLRVIISGKKSEYISIFNPLARDKDITINLKDGSQVTATRAGGGRNACKTDDGYVYTSEWPLESPVNPDNISAVYIGDVCLYDCNA